MCGLAGYLRFGDAERSADLERNVRRMAGLLQHRGPDDAGVWIDVEAQVALGHQRLSIIDLSSEGHQPMRSADGRYVIVFNGEIYNFRLLREELEPRGHRFRGHSDTEVILAAICEWGVVGAVQRFVGMFAFAVWDHEASVLHLVRDRLGIKPLYYGRVGRCFVFGSELAAFRAHPEFQGDLDRNALALYFRFAYVPCPYSIYDGIAKLPPGSHLSLSTSSPETEARLEQYWSAAEVAGRGVLDPLRAPEAELVDGVEERLSEAVGQSMIADVPLGAFLSGGIGHPTGQDVYDRVS